MIRKLVIPLTILALLALNGVYTPSAKAAKISPTWHLEYLDVAEAWNLIDELIPEKKDRLTVALIDTGVDVTHSDLQVNIDPEHCVKVTGEEPVIAMPDFPHGTNIAGIIAATSGNTGSTGIASGNGNDLVKVVCANVYEPPRPTMAAATTKDLIKGLEYCASLKPAVINMSLGYAEWMTDNKGELHDTHALQKTIDHIVYDLDIPVVCAAGNYYGQEAWYPSDFDSTISVISTDKYNDAWSNMLSEFSNYGPAKTLSAPGRDIYVPTLKNRYKYAFGTSESAPMVTGTIALMKYVYPDITVPQIRNILCETATDIYTDGPDEFTGYGQVNTYNAVEEAAILAADYGLYDRAQLKTAIEKCRPEIMEGDICEAPLISTKTYPKRAFKLIWNTKLDSIHEAKIYIKEKGDDKYKLAKTVTNGSHFCKFSRLDRIKSHTTYSCKVKLTGTADGKKVTTEFSSPVKIKIK